MNIVPPCTTDSEERNNTSSELLVLPRDPKDDIRALGVVPKDTETRQFLDDIFKHMDHFRYFKQENREKAVDVMYKRIVAAGETIFQQGCRAEYVYIIAGVSRNYGWQDYWSIGKRIASEHRVVASTIQTRINVCLTNSRCILGH